MSDAKRVLEQAIELWNAADREGWAALYTENVEWEAPGGARITGLADLKVKYYDALLEAAPDRASHVDWLFADGDLVAEEGRVHGDAHRNVAEPGRSGDTGDRQEPGLPFQRDLSGRERQDRVDPPLLRPARDPHAARTCPGYRSDLSGSTKASNRHPTGKAYREHDRAGNHGAPRQRREQHDTRDGTRDVQPARPAAMLLILCERRGV